MNWRTGFSALLAVLLSGVLVAWMLRQAPATSSVGRLPAPKLDQPRAPESSRESVVFAGGCFWGVQSVFEHVRGVVAATAGYAGGQASTAQYETVSTGTTGHAESVHVVFDPSQVSFGELLEVYFSVAHNPTELNFQGPDVGSQYRSEIFYTRPEQARIAKAYILQLEAAHDYSCPIVTTLAPLPGFYPAEAYHQDYAAHHPDDLYIRINDAPKLVALQKVWPEYFSAHPAPSR
ncbi:MAG TPA: peptide-methionine (S)-S-oxide reductase MsrA [Terriglobales bacterium]|nr:peptide-methionine (S)-S-oxide reductase MsrA [Terriglobales bacterium]